MRLGIARTIAALGLATVVLSSCGRGEPKAVVVPEKVDTQLVPPGLGGGTLVLDEDGKAKDAFAKLPKNALVADGRLYSIRQSERLVATLQMSTLLPEVDLTDPKRHDEIVGKLLPGVKQELRVAGLSVFQVAGDDKVVYVWFGRQMFEVLQVKGSKIEPEAVLAEIIGYQQASPAWKPLPQAQEVR
jgi:hypothetical protein